MKRFVIFLFFFLLFVLDIDARRRWIPLAVTVVSCNTVGFNSDSGLNDRAFLGENSTNVYAAGTFVADGSYTVCKTTFRVNKIGSPTFNARASIWTNVSGAPGAQIGTASDWIAASTAGADTLMTFPNMGAAITSGTTYWIVLASDNNNASNYLQPDQNAVSATSFHSADGISWGSGGEHNLQFMFTLYH